MPRLFTGIEIPEATRRAISQLRAGVPGARWIDPENYHLTLRFVGDVDRRMAQEIAEALDRVERPAFDISFGSVGAFGGNRPHALWAGVRASPELMDLQAEQERLMQRIGLPAEGRKYQPHVTIARLRGASLPDVARYLDTYGDFRAEPLTVGRFVLFSARQFEGGGPYLVEEAFPLLDYEALYDEEDEETEEMQWPND
ncbi:MAG: RNA 2',3'-cyclic phosphodiesterase [Flavobacteriaceae bacterium]